MIRQRIAALVAAGVLFAAAWEAAHLSGGPWRTSLTAAGFCAVLGAAIVACGLVVLPEGYWLSILGAAARFRDSLRDAKFADDPATSWTLSAMGVVTFAVLVAIFIPRQAPPEGNDQAEYVKLAQEIRQRGGALGCIRDLYAGEFAEANRHPLYPMLLSVSPTYESGKWLSAIMGGLTLMTMTALVWRRFGGLVAGVFCVLLATNGAYLTVSSLVACEILVIFFAGVIWFLSIDENGSSTIRSCVSGAMHGLLYLTKAHAVVLLAGTTIWSVFRLKSDAFRIRNLLTLAVPFVLAALFVASPLLTRNARIYGNPLFNVNGHLMFMDRFVDPVALASEKTSSQLAVEYLQTHTFVQMISREIKGLAWEAFIMIRSLGPAPWDDARVGFGALFGLACLIAAMCDTRVCAGHLLVWAILLWLLFAWYLPIAAGERFILPLLAPAMTLSSVGVLRLFALTRGNNGGANLGRWLIPAAAVWCTLTIVLTFTLLPHEA